METWNERKIYVKAYAEIIEKIKVLVERIQEEESLLYIFFRKEWREKASL